MTTFSRLFKKNGSLEMGLQLSKTMGFREVGFFFLMSIGLEDMHIYETIDNRKSMC